MTTTARPRLLMWIAVLARSRPRSPRPATVKAAPRSPRLALAVAQPERDHDRGAGGLRRGRPRDRVPDQARRLPHQGEPDVRQPVRDVPRCERRHRRDGRRASRGRSSAGPTAGCPDDIPHCYPCAIAAWNEGAMDGFAAGRARRVGLHTAAPSDQLPNYWDWAERFVLFDKFFASAHGPSFPNHLYSIAATSGGAVDNPRRDNAEIRDSLTFGCDAPEAQLRRGETARADRSSCGRASTSSPRATCSRGRASRGPTTRRRRPERLHLVGVQRDPSLPRGPGALAAAHVPGRRRGGGHRGRACSRP